MPEESQEPPNQRRGVGQHPHRGFETVTIVYDGEVESKDSTGNGAEVSVHADGEAVLLVLTGEPIEEPIVGHARS